MANTSVDRSRNLLAHEFWGLPWGELQAIARDLGLSPPLLQAGAKAPHGNQPRQLSLHCRRQSLALVGRQVNAV